MEYDDDLRVLLVQPVEKKHLSVEPQIRYMRMAPQIMGQIHFVLQEPVLQKHQVFLQHEIQLHGYVVNQHDDLL